MLKIAKIALVTVALVGATASTPAFAVKARNVAAGEAWARQMLTLMDTDKNGRVSKREWMRFMEAEFDRLDVDHSGELTVRELARFPAAGSHPGPHR
jgi:hypothetical protein